MIRVHMVCFMLYTAECFTEGRLRQTFLCNAHVTDVKLSDLQKTCGDRQ